MSRLQNEEEHDAGNYALAQATDHAQYHESARAGFRAFSGIDLPPGCVPMPSDSQPWRVWRLDMTKGLAIDDLRLAICDWLLAIGNMRLVLGAWRSAPAHLQLGALVIFLTLLPACSRSPTPPALLDSTPAPTGDLTPTALAIPPNGQNLYVACAAAKQVLVIDPIRRQIARRLPLPGEPSGLALSPDCTRMFVTCAGPASQVLVMDTTSGKVLTTLPAGHTALSPVLSADGKTLFVCNRFNDAVSLFDLRRASENCRIPVAREPVSACLTRDGRLLLVANHLPRGRSDVPYVAATVSVIDVAQRKVIEELRLPNGSINLRQICVSPDGKFACLAQTVGRFQVPVTQLARGWVNTSALTLIDLASLDVLNTVLLDDPDRGAANPWAAAWSGDSRWLCVTHAGTHELSVIDFPALLKKLAALPTTPPPASVKDSYVSSRSAADVPNDLSFLYGLRQRVQLSARGPRAMVIAGNRVFAVGYFSDSLDVVDLSAATPVAEAVALNPGRQTTTARRGEMYFNDATLCFQGWQSCASCHDDDARVDGLNWDLLNDGIGTPKHTRSLVLSHQTPPVMSLGIRATAEIAVRNGIANSLATSLPEEVPAVMDEWIKSLKPTLSPRLVNGRLSERARRGEKLFKSPNTGCINCHDSQLFTDLHAYSVGTQNPFDKEDKEFDTPTLRELWRTSPYLHDGSAATIRDVLTTRNPKDEHGKASQLTTQQIEDLAEYLLSL
jgi:mono/diheme cytochrome c family protein